MIILNFKIYPQTFGEKALELAKIIKEVSESSKTKVVITVSALDAYRLQNQGLETWLQSVDEYSDGKHTGWISSTQAQNIGINGSLLNHSEHRLPKGTIQKIIANKPKDFKIVCCAHSLNQISWIKKSKPDFILYEPPELIASPDKSVASEKADSIKNAVALASPVPLIVGAGIKSTEDVRVSRKMGAIGICLSSAFVLSADPKKLLIKLLEGFDDII
jgi:triosephosphate isomerase (TIM)